MNDCPHCKKPITRPLSHCPGQSKSICLLVNCHRVLLCDRCEFEATLACILKSHRERETA